MPEQQEFTTLRCHREGAIAIVTLERVAALNALNAAMFDDLERVFTRLANGPRVRVVLLTGSGDRAFAAGADIRELVQTDAASGKRVSQRGQHVFNQIERCGKPVIACINGVALGGGCELAMACTLRIASEKAQLGLPETKLGLVPGYGGTQRLVRLAGRGAALRMMLTGQTVGAAEALLLGLVDEVVPASELMARARGLAETLSQRAPLAVAGVLQVVNQSDGIVLDEGLRMEAEVFGELCGTVDKHEGLSAFLEKRSPVWQGK